MSILTLENMKAYIEHCNEVDQKVEESIVLGLKVEEIKNEASKYE